MGERTGSEWVLFWFTGGWMEFTTGWWAVALVVTALAFNAAFMLIGAWLEARHDRRLAGIDAATAGILLLPGPPPRDRTGTPHLLQAAVVMSPAPLGRFAARIRALLGGRIVHHQREVERARREALLRLREKALALGAPVLAGVELGHLSLGRHRVGVVATGTALTPAAPPPSAPTGPIAGRATEAVGAVPPRPRYELLLALSVILTLGLAASWVEQTMMALGDSIYRKIGQLIFRRG